MEDLFIFNIDWGDGSNREYTDEPFRLGWEDVLTHNYDRHGIYEVSATIFRVTRGAPANPPPSTIPGDILGADRWHRFVVRFSKYIS